MCLRRDLRLVRRDLRLVRQAPGAEARRVAAVGSGHMARCCLGDVVPGVVGIAGAARVVAWTGIVGGGRRHSH